MKTIKQVTNNILTVYTILAIGVIIVGALIDNDFLILLGAIVSVIAGLFINNIRTKHITEILKQNNLWTDEVFSKTKSPQTKLTDTEAKTRDGFD